MRHIIVFVLIVFAVFVAHLVVGLWGAIAAALAWPAYLWWYAVREDRGRS